MKVVKNVCYGGFGLSQEACKYIAERSGMTFDEVEDRYTFGSYEYRTDLLLVEAVEVLGKAANGPFAKLKVVKIPDDVVWTITEYDGWETIEEVHRKW